MSAPTLTLLEVAFRLPNTLLLRLGPSQNGDWPAQPSTLEVAVGLADGLPGPLLSAVLPATPPTQPVADGWVTLAWQAPLPAPINSLGLCWRSGQTEGQVEMADSLATALTQLYPADDASYEAQYLNRKQRLGDSRTQLFLVDQICRHYPGSPAYRAAAAVVAGYKAVESGLAEDRLLARAHLENALVWLQALPFNKHPRRNPEHLQLAVLTSLWHVDLSGGDFDACEATLERLRQRTQGLRYHTTLAYPACRSLLLLGWIHWKKGHLDEAQATWLASTRLFALAVRDASPQNVVLFEELRDVQASAVMAAKGLALVNGQLPADMLLDTAQVLGRASRVSGESGARLLNRLQQWLGD